MASGPSNTTPTPRRALQSTLRDTQKALRAERAFGGLATAVSIRREAHRTPVIADRLAAVRARRPGGSLAADWTDRIETLGDLPLDSRARRAAFPEMVEAFSLPPLRQVMIPERCSCAAGLHAVSMAGRLYRDERRVATWHREVLLDQRVVIHHVPQVDPHFRRAGIGPGLLKQGLALYDRLGLGWIVLYAALETGRWHWARCGVDFLPGESTYDCAENLDAGHSHPTLSPRNPARLSLSMRDFRGAR